MRYEMMLPHQLRRAMDENWPCVLPLGVLEYHSEHLALGMDTFAVTRILERLEKEMNIVILPAFWYGAGSYCVEPAERNGTVQVECESLIPVARDLFASLLRIGLRNVHFFIHHQSENFQSGMPTDLAFRTAAKQAIFDRLKEERGDGWWGDEKMADYYSQQEAGTSPFDWIQGHALMDEEIISQYDFDHAGIGETSLMMALCPEGVDMEKHNPSKWYSRSATEATAEYGEKAVNLILERMKKILRPH